MLCQGLKITILLIVLVITPRITQAATPLLEIVTARGTFVGKNLVHDEQVCWVMQPDGKLQPVRIDEVQQFQQKAPEFRPCSAAELKQQLQREFGSQFEIKATAHYLVCARPGHAERYAELFEQLYREFYVYLSTRNFSVKQPEFPLVAVVFPSREEFQAYANADLASQPPGLLGYYSCLTNRVALYDTGTSHQTGSGSRATSRKKPELPEELQKTILHEATHQVAFNLGLHSRIGPAPRWVTEGLALVFEHPDARTALKTSAAKHRLNRERYFWFAGYQQASRPAQALTAFVERDALFLQQPLNAYSEAWALSFFLMETRPTAYTSYLKLLADRAPLKPYSAAERLTDFRHCFGEDLQQLEVEYLRFIKRLN